MILPNNVGLGRLELYLAMKGWLFHGLLRSVVAIGHRSLQVVCFSIIDICRIPILFSDLIRNVLTTYAPEGLASRFPGVNRIRRSNLSALGPNHQHHSDGHEKLNAQALNMGGVGLNIYGIKDQWSSYILHLVVLPNNRLSTTIGHVHLDAVEKHKCKFKLIPFCSKNLAY